MALSTLRPGSTFKIERTKSFSHKFHTNLHENLTAGFGTDFLITSQDDVPFKCHMMILATVCPYFEALFRCSLKESDLCEIRIENMNGDMLSAIIEYCYTGEINIGQESFREVIQAADFLQMDDLKEEFASFVLSDLTSDNCIDWWQFAKVHGMSPVVDACKNIVLKKFAQISKMEDFLSLTLDELTEVLQDKMLWVEDEDPVLAAVVNWVHHNDMEESVNEIMKHVHFDHCTDSFLQEMLKLHPTYLEDYKRHYLRYKTEQYASYMYIPFNKSEPSSTTEPKDIKLEIEGVKESTVANIPRIRFLKRDTIPGILVLGGMKATERTAAIPAKEHWRDMPLGLMLKPVSGNGKWKKYSLPDHDKLAFLGSMSICQVEEGLVVSGGMTYAKPPNVSLWEGKDLAYKVVNTCLLYNAFSGKWEDLPNLLSPRRNHASVMTGDVLYLLGGLGPCDEHPEPRSAESLNWLSKGSWKKRSLLPESITGVNLEAYALEEYVFAFPKDCMEVLLCYDALLDTWSDSPQVPVQDGVLWEVTGAVLDSRVFLLSAYGAMLAYVPCTEQWHVLDFAAPCRFFSTLVPYSGELYLVGGCSEKAGFKFFHDEKVVVKYTVALGQWKSCKHILPSRCAQHQACVLPLFKPRAGKWQ